MCHRLLHRTLSILRSEPDGKIAGGIGTPWYQTSYDETVVWWRFTFRPSAQSPANPGYRNWHWHLGNGNGRSISRCYDYWDWSITCPAIVVWDYLSSEVVDSRERAARAKISRVPDNVRFVIDDVESKEWSWRESYFDYIHSRFMICSISSWRALMRKAFRYECLSIP